MRLAQPARLSGPGYSLALAGALRPGHVPISVPTMVRIWDKPAHMQAEPHCPTDALREFVARGLSRTRERASVLICVAAAEHFRACDPPGWNARSLSEASSFSEEPVPLFSARRFSKPPALRRADDRSRLLPVARLQQHHVAVAVAARREGTSNCAEPPRHSPSRVMPRTTLAYVTVRPSFSPRPIGTVCERITGRIHSSAMAVRSGAASIPTVTIPSRSDTVNGTGRPCGPASAMLCSTWTRSEPRQGFDPVHNGLGRVDLPVAARIGIAPLPGAEERMRQRVLPAEIVPVIDREGEGDEVRTVGELRQELVGGRAGGASLAGKKLDRPSARLRADWPLPDLPGTRTRGPEAQALDRTIIRPLNTSGGEGNSLCLERRVKGLGRVKPEPIRWRSRFRSVREAGTRQRRCIHSHCSGNSRTQPSTTVVMACMAPRTSISPPASRGRSRAGSIAAGSGGREAGSPGRRGPGIRSGRPNLARIGFTRAGRPMKLTRTPRVKC